MTPETRKELRDANPHDSDELFAAACRRIREFEKNAEIDDYPAFYNQVVSIMVNTTNSRFYIYG